MPLSTKVLLHDKHSGGAIYYTAEKHHPFTMAQADILRQFLTDETSKIME